MFTDERIAKLNAERLAEVKPELARKCYKIIEIAKANNYDLLVTCGYRSNAEQDRLYAIGRRGIKGEKKVTKARAGQSNHNHREAVDFAFIIKGEISWDEKLYQNIGKWCAIVGLNWGGNWKSFKDYPHVEL